MENKKSYRTNGFLDKLKAQVQPSENLKNCDESRIDALRKEKTQALRDCLALEKLQKQFREEVKKTEEEKLEALGEQVVKYRLEGVRDLPMPLYVILPKEPNGEAILYLHGHDPAGTWGAFVTRPDKEPYHKNIAIKMAREGYTVYLPELMGFGEATYTYIKKGEEEQSECFLNAGYLAMCGYSLAGLRTFQSLLTLEQMKQDGFSKLGLFGVSGGGLIGMFTAVLAPEIEKIMLHSFTNTWKHSALGKEHCVDNYVQGIISVGDSYEILSLAAPRALFVCNGMWDRPFPQAGSEVAFPFLEEVYDRIGAKEKFTSVLFPGQHEVNSEETLKWLRENK